MSFEGAATPLLDLLRSSPTLFQDSLATNSDWSGGRMFLPLFSAAVRGAGARSSARAVLDQAKAAQSNPLFASRYVTEAAAENGGDATAADPVLARFGKDFRYIRGLFLVLALAPSYCRLTLSYFRVRLGG
jgi:hypothetical protein